MIGDSTMANKPLDGNPERGWGQLFPLFFDSTVTIENHAMNGRSTRSFLRENRWQPILDKLQAGDYVIIQFGHNDESKDKGDRYTPPEDFKKNLIKFVQETRSKNALPILCTPIMRRRFDEHGKFYDVHGEYPDLVRQVASELNVPLLEMHRKSEQLIIGFGDEESKKLFLWAEPGIYSQAMDGKEDNTHFSEFGAIHMAELAVEGLKELNIELAQHLKNVTMSDVLAQKINLQTTYTNPIIFADYSDPDVIRTGKDYYMVASSFSSVPGIPVLHSTDLVHWMIIGHALSSLPSPEFDTPQPGKGVWAPSIRYHNDEFWVYYGDPDRGIFLSKSQHAEGPWQKPVVVKEAKGWIDPCPFWDDDGNAYVVHAWAKSRAGFNSILTLNKMSSDGRTILDTGITVFDGTKSQPTIEGPKMYKKDGYYYIFAPAGGVVNGWQTVLRSKNIYGPYEEKIVMDQGSTLINGPHQGAWVETEKGESWFFHFQDRGAFGRVLHLQPVQWVNGFPVVGNDPDGDGKGEPVLSWNMPNVAPDYSPVIAQRSDDFSSSPLGLQWQWQANPEDTWYSFGQRKNALRLVAVPVLANSSLIADYPNVLLQKFYGPSFSVTTLLHVDSLEDGEKAGLVVAGTDNSSITIKREQHSLILARIQDKEIEKERKEIEEITKNVTADSIFFHLSVDSLANCSFSYSLDGASYESLGETFKANPGKWIGAKVGLFCIAQKSSQHNGFIDIDWFRFTK